MKETRRSSIKKISTIWQGNPRLAKLRPNKKEIPDQGIKIDQILVSNQNVLSFEATT